MSWVVRGCRVVQGGAFVAGVGVMVFACGMHVLWDDESAGRPVWFPPTSPRIAPLQTDALADG